MDILTIIRVIAVICAGLLAGIFLGYRAGPQHALQKLNPSSFVQFQQVVHMHYVRFMPLLNITAMLTAIVWLVMLGSRWASVEFWLIAVATCGIVLVAALTRAVNVPLNNRLMTWNIDAPPSDLGKVWTPWNRVNTVRAFVSTGVLICEAVALGLRA
jgi:uncharacterized membrane protein